MEENTDRKRVAIARMEMVGIGFGGGGSTVSPAPVEPMESFPWPPAVPAAPAAPAEPAKSQAQIDLDADLESKTAISASKRKGRKSTILTQGLKGSPETAGKGLLSYESMTGLTEGKDKLGA
jgi:hypothetical protein